MITDVIFIGIAGVTLLGAFLAVWLRNVLYNALSLILCLFGVACLFIYLNSEFLAVIEVIIYIGAITIAIIFAIMLSQPMFQQAEKRDPKKFLRSFAIAALFFAELFTTLRRAPWNDAGVEGDYSLKAVGREFLTTNILPFEAVSLVLLIAIVGALVLSASKEADR